jgi:peptidoglycan/LPS O-acetylase OafA/YrhL
MFILASGLSRGLEPHPVLHSTVFPALALMLTIGAAAASYQWFEKPFLKLKTRFQRVRSIPL